MIPLEQALADFKQQVIKSILDTPQQRSGATLEVERISLTLELEARQIPGPAGKPIAAYFVRESRASSPSSLSNESLPQVQRSPGKHTLVIEFKPVLLGSKQTSQPGESDPLVSESPGLIELAASILDDPTLLATLSGVLGAPGFDSSARATLLREVMEGLPAEKTSDLIAALKQPPGTLISEDIRQACHLFRGILLSGPAKSVSKGADIFEALFARHSIQSILVCLQKAWKNQDDWM